MRFTAAAFWTRPKVGAGAEPEQGRVRRERVLAAQLLGRPFQQRPVRQELAPGQQDLDQRPVALAARVAARPDRAQPPSIGHIHHVQAIQQRAPQRGTGHTGHVLIRDRHPHPSRLPAGSSDDLSGLEQRRGSVHPSGAPLADRFVGRTPNRPRQRGTCRVNPTDQTSPAAISGSEPEELEARFEPFDRDVVSSSPLPHLRATGGGRSASPARRGASARRRPSSS